VLGRCVVSPANRQQYDDAFEYETGSIYNNYTIYICCKHFSKSISLFFIASGKVDNNSICIHYEFVPVIVWYLELQLPM